MRSYIGQGATEYLVLLAVVLIVALVSVALLGFFPGMASDAQATQSQMYWRSTSPISIEEWNARYVMVWDGATIPTWIVKNNGAYPIRITKLLGGSARSMSTFVCKRGSTGFCPVENNQYNISDYYYLAPGEKKYFMENEYGMVGMQLDGPTVVSIYFYAARTLCENSASRGTLIINNFGFEYIEYLEGQQLTKRQIGAKPLIIKCREPE
jgi:hypothetical protein